MTPDLSQWLLSVRVTDVAFFALDGLGEQYSRNKIFSLGIGHKVRLFVQRFLLTESRTGLSLGGFLSYKIASNEIETQ